MLRVNKARREADRQRFRGNSTERRSNLRQSASQRIQNETEAKREYLRHRASQRIQNETEEEVEDSRQRVSQRIQMKLKKKQMQGENMQDKEYYKEYKMKLKVKQNTLFSICI